MDQALTFPPDGYQSGGQAWDPSRADIVVLLSESKHCETQPIYYGSNYTFLVTLDGGPAGQSFAVYKPARGEYPLYDFPSGTLYRREVATYIVDHLLGWDQVPATVVADGKHGPGSVQLFIESTAEGEIEIRELQRLVLLDHIINNADRKAEHLLISGDRKLWGIDHGLTFHVQPKLRTVLWHFAGRRIAGEDRADIERLAASLTEKGDADVARLGELISAAEYRALTTRASRLAEGGRFPDPRYKPVPYRW